MKKFFSILFLFAICTSFAKAETTYDPFTQNNFVVWGQGFGQNTVVRMPASAQSTVPTAVWGLAQASAGLQIRFRTNAVSIKVSYRGLSSYTSNLWFSQFGSNGVDLYARNSDGDWLWVYPVTKSVGSSYSYTNIAPADSRRYSSEGYEYCLYLPSYATISPLNITVNDGASFEFIPVPTDKKPVLCYGTSICQGAAASRPGQIWSNIISRAFPDRPVVNFGFSGAGKMETSVINVINQVDAAVYIFDNLPNLSASSNIEELYSSAVNTLKASHPNAAIIFTEHCGFADSEMYVNRKNDVLQMNSKLYSVYQNLINAGVKNLYYITKEELGLDPATDFGDWIHANDKGMYQYGKAYIAKLNEVFQNISSGVDTPSQSVDSLIDTSYYNIQGIQIEKPLQKNMVYIMSKQSNSKQANKIIIK